MTSSPTSTVSVSDSASGPVSTYASQRSGKMPARRGRFAKVRGSAPTVRAPYKWTAYDTVSTSVIAILAFITRFLGLSTISDAGTPVFDEKHYVPQAWDMVQSWAGPAIGGIESNPGYGLVVHPPLAKQIEAIGEMIFGYTPLGWRVMTALFGVATVLMIMALARQLSHSPFVALCAGFLALFDGVLLIGSRFGMMDIFQVFFIVAATWALVHDRQQVRQRLHSAWEKGQLRDGYSPRFGFRWWRFLTGVFLGCALSVKWSGLYYIAFFGIYIVLSDMRLRSQYGARSPFFTTLLKDAFSSFFALVIVPIILYLWSWRAWFGFDTAVYRHAREQGLIDDTYPRFLESLPDTVANFFYYHLSVLRFHASLTSSAGNHHPWDSKPWSWLAGTRPVLYYKASNCNDGECQQAIFLFGTPAIWWLIVPVLLWSIWAVIIKKDHRYVIPLVAFAAGFLPWLANSDRQMYFFYATALIPFVIVMLALACGDISQHGRILTWNWLRLITPLPLRTGQIAVICYLALVAAMFVYFSPILYGIPISNAHYASIMWLPSWD